MLQPFAVSIKSRFADMYVKGADIILELSDIRSNGADIMLELSDIRSKSADKTKKEPIRSFLSDWFLFIYAQCFKANPF